MPADAGASPREDGPQRALVGVVVALAVERRSLKVASRATGSTVVIQSGPGFERAAAAARAAIRAGATALLSWGLAGGLAEQARPGSVLVPDRIVTSDGRVLPTDDAWRRAFLARLGDDVDRVDGALLTVDRVLATPAAKACSASVSGAVAADMESAAIAELARTHGLPFLAVRVVADGSSEALPRRVDDWLTPEGQARLAPLLRVLLEPRELVRLVRLARRSRAATRVLTALATHVAGPDPSGADATDRRAEIAT